MTRPAMAFALWSTALIIVASIAPLFLVALVCVR